MQVDGFGKKDNNKFIIRAVGHSMEPRINDGDYCLFQSYHGGSREGKIILAEHHGSVDTDYEGSYSIKQYHSTKKYNEFGEWEHESVELHPLNRAYDPIILSPDEIEDFCIIGEFVKVVSFLKNGWQFLSYIPKKVDILPKLVGRLWAIGYRRVIFLQKCKKNAQKICKR